MASQQQGKDGSESFWGNEGFVNLSVRDRDGVWIFLVGSKNLSCSPRWEAIPETARTGSERRRPSSFIQINQGGVAIIRREVPDDRSD